MEKKARVSVLAAAQAYAVLPLIGSVVWIPTAARALRVSEIMAGELATIMLLAIAFGSLALTPHFARRSPRAVVLCSTALMMSTDMLTGLCHPQLPLFICLRIVDGLAAGVCIGLTSILAAEADNEVMTFGILQLTQALLGVAAFLLSAPMLHWFGFTGIFDLIAFAWLPLLPLVLTLPAASGTRRKDVTSESPARASRRGFKLRADILAACVGVVLVFAAYNGIFSSAGYFTARLHADLVDLSIVLAAGSGSCALGALVGAFSGGRISERVMVICGGLGEVLSLAAAGFGMGLIPLAVAVCGVTFFLFIAVPAFFASISRMDTDGHAAAAVQAAALLGIALGPALANLISALASLSVTALVASGGSALGFAFILRTASSEAAEISSTVT